MVGEWRAVCRVDTGGFRGTSRWWKGIIRVSKNVSLGVFLFRVSWTVVAVGVSRCSNRIVRRLLMTIERVLLRLSLLALFPSPLGEEEAIRLIRCLSIESFDELRRATNGYPPFPSAR